jgi:DNA-binding transcriptional MerR regulator
MTGTWLGPRAVAEACGVSTDTLRHYERLGLLPQTARSTAGYRRFPPDTVDRVRLIQRALTIGFSLRELASVLERRERGEPPCRRVRALVGERLTALESRLTELSQLRDEMRRLLREWDARLARTPGGQRARLLDVLHVHPVAANRRGIRG